MEMKPLKKFSSIIQMGGFSAISRYSRHKKHKKREEISPFFVLFVLFVPFVAEIIPWDYSEVSNLYPAHANDNMNNCTVRRAGSKPRPPLPPGGDLAEGGREGRAPVLNSERAKEGRGSQPRLCHGVPGQGIQERRGKLHKGFVIVKLPSPGKQLKDH
jgi:hypothetical protein